MLSLQTLAQGVLSFIVQTSAPASTLPSQAVDVQGGTVTSTSPIQGGNGRLFNVNVNTAQGASFLTIGTVAGITLANALTTTASNTLRVNLDGQNPQVSMAQAQHWCSDKQLNMSSAS